MDLSTFPLPPSRQFVDGPALGLLGRLACLEGGPQDKTYVPHHLCESQDAQRLWEALFEDLDWDHSIEPLVVTKESLTRMGMAIRKSSTVPFGETTTWSRGAHFALMAHHKTGRPATTWLINRMVQFINDSQDSAVLNDVFGLHDEFEVAWEWAEARWGNTIPTGNGDGGSTQPSDGETNEDESTEDRAARGSPTVSDQGDGAGPDEIEGDSRDAQAGGRAARGKTHSANSGGATPALRALELGASDGLARMVVPSEPVAASSSSPSVVSLSECTPGQMAFMCLHVKQVNLSGLQGDFGA